MIRLAAGLATAAALSAPVTAHAQYQRNVITNSGNGAGNTITAVNRGIQLHAPGGGYAPAFAPQAPVGYDYQQPQYAAQPQYDYQPQYAPQQPFAPAGFGGYGMSRNFINESGNGYGNTIRAVNRGGYGGYGGYTPGGQFPFGPNGFNVNVNVIANSGNGVGNTIVAGNGGKPGFSFGPNGININVVKNSGNGAGNVIKLFNR